MRMTMSFTLPEERDEFESANNGMLYHIVLQELDNHLRSKLKYEVLTEEQSKIYDEVRSKLYELANDRGVTI